MEERLRHDLRNQLGIVLGFAEVLLAGAAEDDPSRADLEEIQRAAQAALELVERDSPRHPGDAG
jgi:signal transduction histidine kinase